jgi:hypothetical protein
MYGKTYWSAQRSCRTPTAAFAAPFTGLAMAMTTAEAIAVFRRACAEA